MDLPWETDEGGGSESQATLASSVLLVDDEAVVRDVFSRLLAREADIALSLAEDAEQAVELLRSQRFDVLITDKNLPGMGGIELIAEARNLRPMIEAIMITGYASAESVIAAFAAGASDYLVKPFDDLRVVKAKIRAALERRNQRAKSRETARSMAREAQSLLGQGQDAPEPAWQKLESKFSEYEKAIRDGGKGSVVVVGGDEAVRTLATSGFDVQKVGEGSPLLRFADVVVVETSTPDWRGMVERLRSNTGDVLLLASPYSDLSDLLEAISLRIDLIGFCGKAPASALPERVRSVLMRRAVERAQTDLADALGEFRQVLSLKNV
jgi:CheY-like chemotaxis protein